MASSIKPILSLSKLMRDEKYLLDNGAEFSTDKSSATLNGVKYLYTDLGYYLSLNDGELCLSEEIVRNNSGSTAHVKYKIDDKYLTSGLILVVSGDRLLPILTPMNSSIRDVVLGNEEMLSGNVADKVIKYLGFSDLINSFVVDRNLISLFTDGDVMKVTTGLNEEIPIGDVSYISEDLRIKIDEMVSDIEDVYRNISEIKSILGETSDQVIDKNNISDYVSIKTLLRYDIIDTVDIPNNITDRRKYRIIHNQAYVRVDSIWDSSPDNSVDPYAYWFPRKSYEIVRSRILYGDLVELSILYRKNISPSNKTNIDKKNLVQESYDGYIESEFYSYETEPINKIMFKDTSGTYPIKMNGKDVLYDNLNEMSVSIKILVQDSFVVSDDFYIQINSETINIFPRYEDITEYYVKACRKINVI